MFYRLHRKSDKPEDGLAVNGWVRSWDGIVTEVSCAKLGRFHGKSIRQLMLWVDEFNIQWSVTERAQ